MPLDANFKEKTDQLVRETFEIYSKAGVAPRIADIWKCENQGDFLCGYFVGELIGSAQSAFPIVHKREPTDEDYAEILSIVERYSKEIRGFFSKFN